MMTILSPLALLVALPLAQPDSPQPYIRINESKPVEVNGAYFEALAEEKWPALNPRTIGISKIEVQLRITNRSGKDLVFPTFDTIRVNSTTSMAIEFPVEEVATKLATRGRSSSPQENNSAYAATRSCPGTVIASR